MAKLTSQDKKIMFNLFMRSNVIQGSSNQVVMQGHGVLYTVGSYLQEFYKDDPEEMKNAFDRHSTYYNTNPYTGAIVWVLIYILEKKRAQNKEAVSAESIQNMKMALMGPLAAIGDTLFQGSLGTIIAAMVMGMAQEGNFMAPFLYVAIFMLIFAGGKWFFLYMAYTKGEEFVTSLLETDMFSRLEEVISIAGLMMMGCLASTTIKFNLNWIINIGGVETNIQQGIFDKLLPGVLPLCILFGCFHFLNKRVAPTKIIYGLMIICVVLSYLGIV